MQLNKMVQVTGYGNQYDVQQKQCQSLKEKVTPKSFLFFSSFIASKHWAFPLTKFSASKVPTTQKKGKSSLTDASPFVRDVFLSNLQYSRPELFHLTRLCMGINKPKEMLLIISITNFIKL